MLQSLLLFPIYCLVVKSVIIEYPSNELIEQRIRKDIDSFDQIFRYYLVPHEIQFHINATKVNLPYFLRCKGTKKTVNFTIPASASKYLTLETDSKTNTIIATLIKPRLNENLVGRYTCSELINDKIDRKVVHVFINDERTVFTSKTYPQVYKQTGIHFFNLPCQTTNWFARMSCSLPTDRSQCQKRSCNEREIQINELKCNTPICLGKEPCIPVYYKPSDLVTEKVFFDPQIGFAIENPAVPNTLKQFTCMSTYTPSQESYIPFDSSEPDFIQIHQSSLTIMSDEIVRLTCEIQYGTSLSRKAPTLFWFEDIYNLHLESNQTEKAVFNFQTQVYSRNSSITLRGFKSNKVYRFYCVRISDQGLYSRSIDISCVDEPSLDLEINPSGPDNSNQIAYGNDATYDISVFTIPRSSIILDISRQGASLTSDKRFQLIPIINQENQFFEYTLTISNVTFEDDLDLKITAKSSALTKTVLLKPNIIGNPIGELAFVPEQIPLSILWRNEYNKDKLNIYTYGIHKNESYRIVCTIRHRSDIKRPLNVYIKYVQCPIDNCLSNLISKTCQTSINQPTLKTASTLINNFQTQFVSTNTHTIDNPNVGHQYLCCYEQNGLVSIAKAIAIVSNKRNLFSVDKPEFGLVIGDSLSYRCEGHDLIYSDLRMIYHDGLFPYERSVFDDQWRLQGTNQFKKIDIDWKAVIDHNTRTKIIQVKTPPLKMIGNAGYLQCIAQSKRSDFIPNRNDTYNSIVDAAVPLQFKNNLPIVSRLDRKTGDNVELDCRFNGLPKPKLTWFKGKLPLNNTDSTLQFGNNNDSISINRAQAFDTGYYTCELNNGHGPIIRRSFDLRVKGTNPNSKMGRIVSISILVSALLLLIMLILLTIFAIKYYQMKRKVKDSLFYEKQLSGTEDNFATTQQIRTFLSYVNGDNLPMAKDDFKELGRGQFGVVYQVRLPDVGLVAAKALPETIRKVPQRRNKYKKGTNDDEHENMLSKHEIEKKKASEMLIDEIKVMNKAGKHVNIIALVKVAYPESKLKFLFLGGPIRDEDSFYLMELCSNGSLESMLKRFIQPPPIDKNKLSLYETLSKQIQPNMTVDEVYNECTLTDDDLILIAYQVACGLDYLNRRQIAHCDIAPRNVLVTSRFIMKICDFGLATWTSYKNYREQLEQNDSVQLEKKHNDIATHNLTPELARAFLRASNPDERLLLNKSSIKSDVWSFGIFLWTLFLKCRIRPFNKLSEERKNRPNGQNFFHQLALVVSEGRVLRYIDYHPEIPRNIYAIIRECLVEENQRPEMTRIRALLCHTKMLSRKAFQYYASQYDRYQEENARDDNVERFGDDQGVSDLPSFDGDYTTTDNRTTANPASYDNVKYRPVKSDYDSYQSNIDYPQDENGDSYLAPRNKTATDSTKPIVESSSAQTYINDRRPTRPAPPPPPPPPPPSSSTRKPNDLDDSYL